VLDRAAVARLDDPAISSRCFSGEISAVHGPIEDVIRASSE